MPESEARALGCELAEWIETYYVGLDAVRARGFDPVAALRSARHVREIERVFIGLGDRHTRVSFQSLARDRGRGTNLGTIGQVQLPVRIGTAVRHSSAHERERFWVTEIARGAVSDARLRGLRPGDQVTHWNGVPVERVVVRLGEQLRGAHVHAQRRLGVRALTRRVVEPRRLPEEDWVVLTCRRGANVTHHRLEWTERLLEWRPRIEVDDALPEGDRIRIRHLGEPEEMTGLLKTLTKQRSSGRPLVLDLRGNAGGSVHGMSAVFEAVSGQSADSRLRFQFRASKHLAKSVSRCARWSRWTGAQRGGFFPPHPIDGGSGVSKRRAADARPGAADARPTRRVGVLVDASTFSAAEILTALLRAEGATVLGTDPWTGGGADNGWSLAALRRLCPETWIPLDAGEPDPVGALCAYCAQYGLDIGPSWVEKETLHWRLAARGGSPSSQLAVWAPDTPDAIAVHAIDRSLRALGDHAVELQLSVRRPLIRCGGDWHPIEHLEVDHRVPQTLRDLLEDDADLLRTSLRILTEEARVAPSGPETTAPRIA